MADRLLFEPLHVVAEDVRERRVSPPELTEAALRQVERWAPALNPFITQTPEQALSMARQAERELAAGTYHGPLHGIPVVLKDLFETAGVRTTAGSPTLANHLPERDATVVRRLREAGAVFIGKTGMPQFAEEPTSTNPFYGGVHNPWNLAYDSGGSSSGTAAAIAAGMAWCGPGSDTGGSIRIPSAACGLVGLKPTYGRVSLRGVLPLSISVDHVGPMARTVRDAALLLDVLTSYDPDDLCSREVPAQDDGPFDLDGGIHGLRVAALATDGGTVERDIAAAFVAGVTTLTQAGAIVEELAMPEMPEMIDATEPLFVAEVFDHYGHLLAEHTDQIASNVRNTLGRGQRVTGAEAIAARRRLEHDLHQVERKLRGFDLLVSPTLALYPPPAGERCLPLVRLTALWNYAGWPAVSVPVGLSDEGLPIGFQIVARPWREGLALRAARVIERAHALDFPPLGLRAGQASQTGA